MYLLANKHRYFFTLNYYQSTGHGIATCHPGQIPCKVHTFIDSFDRQIIIYVFPSLLIILGYQWLTDVTLSWVAVLYMTRSAQIMWLANIGN